MNGDAHTASGLAAGIAAGDTRARAKREPTLPEICGWAAGGVCGAKIPDVLEPAYCPSHRKFCHSGCTLGLNLLALQSKTLESWIQSLHRKAAEQRLRSQSDPQNAFLYSIGAILYEFLAGVLPALLAGYASHLIADSTTPCGIPLI
jgi:membrane-bound metal-dependent hydrolase YbcI (DUF457 family)